MPLQESLLTVVNNAIGRAKDGVTLSEVWQILTECSGLAVEIAAEMSTLTKPEKKALVDATILAAYQAIKPFISVGWLTPLWWFIDPLVIAAIPKITEGVYKLLKPHLAS